MKIYTKTGDDGTTGLIGGERVLKFHTRVECYGTVDELNSHLGLLRTQINTEADLKTVGEIQNRLFTAGAYLASIPESRMILPELTEDDVKMLEAEIDRLTGVLPELKNFILPGGSAAGAQAHVARCVCRRAERLVVHLAETETVDGIVVRYLNRLSDYLFTLGRKLDADSGAEEVIWAPRSK